MQCSQPYFDYACSTWYPNPNEQLIKKIQIAQNKTIRFCLKLGKRHHISCTKFEAINWLPVYERVHQCINAITFKIFNNVCRNYLKEVYEYTPQSIKKSRSNLGKFKVPFWKKNIGQNGISYIGPSLWNNLLGFIKTTTVLKTFNNNLQKQYLGNLAGRQDQ